MMDRKTHPVLDTSDGPEEVDLRQRHVAKDKIGNGNLDRASDDSSSDGGEVTLKKRVGLISGVALIVGTMIGSGIFISPKGVLRGTGSVGLSLVSWAICGIIAMLGSLVYAELGTLIHASGAEYAYLREGIHPIVAFLFSWASVLLLRPASLSIISLTCAEYVMVPLFDDGCGVPPGMNQKMTAAVVVRSLTYAELGTLISESGGEYAYLKGAFGNVPAFLLSWVSVLLLKPSSLSIIALTCAEYIMVPLYDDGCGAAPIMETKMLAIAVVIILVALNGYSVRAATGVQVIFTFAKILALIIIIIGGIVKLAQGNTQHLAAGFEGTEGNVGAIAIGLYNGMWAYDGWNNLNYVTEEIINPQKNLPRSILIGIPLVTILYLLVNISYFTVMSVEDLLASPAVAVTWAEAVIPAAAWIIPVFVALSTFGAANGTLFTGGRLTFVAAREGHMLELLSMVHVKRFTPLPSLVFTTILSLIFIIPGDIGSLIDFFNFAVWFFYGGTALACIVMRFTTKYKNAHRPYKVPLVIPIIVFLISLFLVIAPIIDDPQIEFLYAFVFIVGGLIFYVPFVHFKLFPPCMEQITYFFQLLMQSCPPTVEPEA